MGIRTEWAQWRPVVLSTHMVDSSLALVAVEEPATRNRGCSPNFYNVKLNESTKRDNCIYVESRFELQSFAHVHRSHCAHKFMDIDSHVTNVFNSK